MTPDDLILTARGLVHRGMTYPCTIGRTGVVAGRRKREGDGATPAGIHRIIGCLYRPDRMVKPCDWAVPIRPGDLWCDDPDHADYNLMVRAPFAGRHERLFRADPVYDLILLTDWNWPQADPGGGSAIFVHQWRRPGAPTAGCVALARESLLAIVARIRHESRLVIRG
jgi:L,D-peptidoglycan transpeptidase YkuD (ErfK/YbiS/YcfS/YnhG family)